MGDWWYRNILEPGKLPLLLALSAFVVTFAATRIITRMIRAGKGPFRNVTPGGLHVHHCVPGVILMTVGGFTAIGGGRTGWGAAAAAVLFGMGTGLVLDEFALILHLSDVYWTKEGTISIEVVIMTSALAALLLCGFLPLGVDGLTPDEEQNRLTAVGTVLFNLVLAIMALIKGKPRMAVLGVVVPLIALVAAVRLARPVSPWARRFYPGRPKARARTIKRAYHHDRRWSGLRRKVDYLIGGAPSP
ncbi:hypothetical protein OTB20_23200 [Streptomyces sp. H27-H1]|uniref:hypothetical protein n=1 Tax=Streptomyces sp. H27-H1 TaxID=2996461 RepID=UPI0022709D38|nr:hypothetical protein [Streptomyces sp. H27-H1]MCY0929054.1 hypothetical protein [Streptomyces sp. H27-H1]